MADRTPPFLGDAQALTRLLARQAQPETVYGPPPITATAELTA